MKDLQACWADGRLRNQHITGRCGSTPLCCRQTVVKYCIKSLYTALCCSQALSVLWNWTLAMWQEKLVYTVYWIFVCFRVNVGKLLTRLLKFLWEKKAPVIGTQVRIIHSVRSCIKNNPVVWKYHRKRLKNFQCLKTVIFSLKSEMYKKANKRQLCAQNCHILKYNR